MHAYTGCVQHAGLVLSRYLSFSIWVSAHSCLRTPAPRRHEAIALLRRKPGNDEMALTRCLIIGRSDSVKSHAHQARRYPVHISLADTPGGTQCTHWCPQFSAKLYQWITLEAHAGGFMLSRALMLLLSSSSCRNVARASPWACVVCAAVLVGGKLPIRGVPALQLVTMVHIEVEYVKLSLTLIGSLGQHIGEVRDADGGLD